MKFSPGDKILLKQTGEEGSVIAIISKDMVEVEVNGVHFPVYMDEIDHPYLKWFTEKAKPKTKSKPEQLPVEKERHKMPKLARGIYLSFLPVFKAEAFEDIVDRVKIYLQNELPEDIFYKYEAIDKNQKQLFKLEGKLHGFGHLYLHNLLFEEMSEQPRFHFELTDAGNINNETATGTIRIKPQKLFQHINDLLQRNEPMFSYVCTEGFVPKEKPRKTQVHIPVKTAKQPLAAKDWRAALPRFEIDLHIESLMPDAKGLSNTDMLDIQLDALRKHLDVIISNRQERTMIIHGLGKGILKNEVHKILKQTPEVDRFSNEWQAAYGFGATEVWFKY